MKRETLFELAWMLPSLALPAAMLVAVVVTAFGAGIHVPTHEGRVDPTALDESALFAEPGVFQVGPKAYEVRLIARTWSFEPADVTIPAGSEVTFVGTSADIVHGMIIPTTNVNIMLVPGQIARTTVRFDEPGTHPYICHEYCGVAHHTMWGRLTVGEAEPDPYADNERRVDQ